MIQNINVNSEHFERAAYALRESLTKFSTETFEQSCREFSASVDKLARVLGMQAENDQRKAIGASMAYDESAFMNM